MDYELFKKEFYKISNINLSLYKEKQMLRRINSLISKHKFEGFKDFLEAIKKDDELYDIFINYLTINVSEFYRNPSQWEILENDILPYLLNKKKNIKIWSSACSTGEEPYTLVMILKKYFPNSNFKIFATDIDMGALERAKNGEYHERNIKDLPKEYLDKYFNSIGNCFYRISDEIKRCVEFKKMNLLEDRYPTDMDLVICRNVLIYFTEDAKSYVYSNFNKSLVNDGILFLGSTEQIIGPQKFGFKSIKTFFYQKNGAPEV